MCGLGTMWGKFGYLISWSKKLDFGIWAKIGKSKQATFAYPLLDHLKSNDQARDKQNHLKPAPVSQDKFFRHSTGRRKYFCPRLYIHRGNA